MAREAAKKKVAALEVVVLEAERVAWKRSEGKWQWESETREKMIEGLRAHRGKKLAMIAKLKEEIGHFQHEILERKGQSKYLTEEVEVEKRKRLDAQECALLDRLATLTSKINLEEEQSTHKMPLANIQSLQDHLAFLESEAYRMEIMDKYHASPIDNVDVSLACKVGFDYLLELLPHESRPAPDHIYYPCHVANYLDILKKISMKGGGIVLDVDDRDEGDEESGDDQDEVATVVVQLTPAPKSSATLPSPTSDPNRAP